jgi:alkaline phosphatase D
LSLVQVACVSLQALSEGVFRLSLDKKGCFVMSAQPVQSRREFVIRIGSITAVAATGSVLSGCGGGSDGPSFNYGVASGDPLSDRIILWTHAKVPNSNANVDLTYEVATDSAFTNIVSSGPAVASASTGFTAKADATGLLPGQQYYYRFRAGLENSPVGRTRTLPSAGAESLKFAVMSCSNYPAGFFNVYAEVVKSDCDYALHLGDYIYE